MFKNYDDLEEHLTRQEVSEMLRKSREKDYESKKFLAALKGIDLDEGQEDADFEKVKRRAVARLKGMTEEQVELEGHFNIIVEDE